MDRVDLLAHFHPGFTPRPEQARLLTSLADAVAEALDDPAAPRVFIVEAPPGVRKSRVASAPAHWSRDAYLLTSQKLLQDQYERDFGADLQLVKGRDNYRCERYPDEGVLTSGGIGRRPRGPVCECPYARAKAAALAGPVFCTNLSYFATLRYWRAEQLRKRRLLVVDEAHGLEGQLVSVFTVAFPPAECAAWFGGPLPRLDDAEDYRSLLGDHLERMEGGAQGAHHPPPRGGGRPRASTTLRTTGACWATTSSVWRGSSSRSIAPSRGCSPPSSRPSTSCGGAPRCG